MFLSQGKECQPHDSLLIFSYHLPVIVNDYCLLFLNVVWIFFCVFFFALDSDISLSNIYPFHSSPLSSLVQALFIFFVLPSLILVLLLKLNYLLFILHRLNTNSLLLLPSLKTFNELRNNPSPLLTPNSS